MTVVYGISEEAINNYRVRIHSTTENVTIQVNSDYRIKSDGAVVDYNPSSEGEDIIFEKNNSLINVITSDGQSIAKGAVISIEKIDEKESCFAVKDLDGKSYAKYPDNAIIKLSSDCKQILVINSTNMETYLKGVIVAEMGGGAPLEALKCQAVAARTLAVKRANKYAVEGFDITNTTSDQAYKGYDEIYFKSSSNVSKAVNETKGIILTVDNKPIDAIYTSNNGGQTADDSFVWGSGLGQSYYISKEDDFDKELNKYTAGWSKLSYNVSFTNEELRDRILQSLKSYPAYFKTPYCTPSFTTIADIVSVEVLNQINGYVTSLKIEDSEGRVYVFKNSANRWLFGLRSQQYDLTREGSSIGLKASTTVKDADVNELFYIKSFDSNILKTSKVSVEGLTVKSASSKKIITAPRYIINGKGYGTGVGMSQNGAMNRADAGQSYREILSFYYDGVDIVNNYGN